MRCERLSGAPVIPYPDNRMLELEVQPTGRPDAETAAGKGKSEDKGKDKPKGKSEGKGDNFKHSQVSHKVCFNYRLLNAIMNLNVNLPFRVDLQSN